MHGYYLRRDISNTDVIDTCAHIWQIQELTIFLLPKIKNTYISKTRANSEKVIAYWDLATSKYPKTIKISLALEKNFVLLTSDD